MTNSKTLFLFRVFFCLIVIGVFIFNNWLVFPTLKTADPILLGITVTLLLFVMRNLYMMQRYPRIFLGESFFRFYKLIALLKSSLFLIVPLVLLFLLISNLFEIDISPNNIDTTPVLFIAFNALAAYLEYALIKTLIE